MASYWLRATYKAERVYLQLAEIFHIERPGPAQPWRSLEAYISWTVRSIGKQSSLLGSAIF